MKEPEKAAETELGTKCHFGLVFQWDLVCEQRGLNQATATFFFIGVTMGAVVFGYLSDRFDPSQAPPPGPQLHRKNSTHMWPSIGDQRGRERRKGNCKGRIQPLTWKLDSSHSGKPCRDPGSASQKMLPGSEKQLWPCLGVRCAADCDHNCCRNNKKTNKKNPVCKTSFSPKME